MITLHTNCTNIDFKRPMRFLSFSKVQIFFRIKSITEDERLNQSQFLWPSDMNLLQHKSRKNNANFYEQRFRKDDCSFSCNKVGFKCNDGVFRAKRQLFVLHSFSGIIWKIRLFLTRQFDVNTNSSHVQNKKQLSLQKYLWIRAH